MCRRPLGIAFLAAGLLALSCVSGDREGEVPVLPPDIPEGTAAGQMLDWDDAAGAWRVIPPPPGSGTVTSVDTGAGLSGGPSTDSITIDLDISPTGGLTTALAGNQLGLVPGGPPGQILLWSGSEWALTAAGAGTVTQVDTGAGLTGGSITTTGTVALDISPTGGLTTALAGNQLGLVSGTAADEVLKWDGTGWSAGNVSGGPGGTITDGSITPEDLSPMGAFDGWVLKWDDISSGWVTAAITGNMIDPMGASTDGDILVWNTSLQEWEGATHDHDVAYINDGAGEIDDAADFGFTAPTHVTDLGADRLDGLDSTAFMQATADNWVNVTGDVMIGALVLSTGAGADVTIDEDGIDRVSGSDVTFGIANTGAGNMTLDVAGNVTASGSIQSGNDVLATQQLISQVLTGTPPLQVSSATLVPMLNADRVDGFNVVTTPAADHLLALDGFAKFPSSALYVGSLGTDVAAGDHDHAGTYTPVVHTHAAADVTSGTLDDARLSANVAMRNTGQTFTGTQTVETGVSDAMGVVVRGAPGQVLNLQEWQDDGAATLAYVTAAGVFGGNGSLLTNLDATSVATGTLDTARYSAYADLGAEAKIGTA
ncbi:MAG: hypothetical protein ACYSU0_03180, partial [Planctomycetota bacterium]